MSNEINTSVTSTEQQGETLSKQGPLSTKEWEGYRISIYDEIVESEPLLMIGEHPLINAGGIATLGGKPKTYKTFLSSAIVGAFFMGEYMNIHTNNSDDQAKVLMVDTEQGRALTQKVQRRIYDICNDDKELLDNRLVTLSVREISHQDRTKALFDALYDIKPKLVVIDGVRDLIKDFNNIEESAEIVNKLMKAASELNCAVIVIIHQNKGDSSIRGHLGGELCNKCETVIDMKRVSDDSVMVSPTYCRGIAFDGFAMRITEEGLPELCSLPVRTKEAKTKVLKKLIEDAMGDTNEMSKKELIEKILKRIPQGEKTANRRITTAVAADLIELLPDGKTYKLINNDL